MITFEELREVINGDCYRVKEDGTIVWRSGMDAGSYCPFIGKNVKVVHNPEGYHKQYTTWPWKDVMKM
jgi:hypothetical protein